MPLEGQCVLVFWNGIEAGGEEEFLYWHVHEHIPERVAIPGFLRGRRYVALDGHPAFFNFYEIAEVADASSPVYRAALNAPSPWTRKVLGTFRDTSRTVCSVALTLGRGEGAFIETLRLETRRDAGSFRDAIADLMAEVARERGIVGVHLARGEIARSRSETAEMTLRGSVDQTADWVAMIEAVEPEAIHRLRKGALADDVLAVAGTSDLRRGLYALQFSLARADIA